MSKTNDYNNGYQNGYWNGSDDAYSRGFEAGKQAERDRIKRAIDGDPAPAETSIFGIVIMSLVLAFLWWCFLKLLSLPAWISGHDDSFLAQLAHQILFWGGIGFIALIALIGIITTIHERLTAKNAPTVKPPDHNTP